MRLVFAVAFAIVLLSPQAHARYLDAHALRLQPLRFDAGVLSTKPNLLPHGLDDGGGSGASATEYVGYGLLATGLILIGAGIAANNNQALLVVGSAIGGIGFYLALGAVCFACIGSRRASLEVGESADRLASVPARLGREATLFAATF